MRNIYDIIREQKVLVDLNIMKYDRYYTNDFIIANEQTLYVQEGFGDKVSKAVKKVIEFIKNVIKKIGEIVKRVFNYFRGESNVVKDAEEDIKTINKLAAEKESGVEKKPDKPKEEPKKEEPKPEPPKEEPKVEPKQVEKPEGPKAPKVDDAKKNIEKYVEPKKEEPKPEPPKEEPKREPERPKVNYTSYSDNRPKNLKSGENKMMNNKFGAYIDAKNLKDLLSQYKLRVYLTNPCGPFSKREELMKKMPAAFDKAINTSMRKFDMLEKDVFENGKDFDATNLCLSMLSVDLFGERHEFTGAENVHKFTELMFKELGDGISERGIDIELAGKKGEKTSEPVYVHKLADDIIDYCSKGPQFCKELGNMRKRISDRLDKLMDEIETRNTNALCRMGFRLGSIVIDIFGDLSHSTTQMYNTYKKIIKAAVKDYAEAKDVGLEIDWDRLNNNRFKSMRTY